MMGDVLTKIEIVTRPDNFEAFKQELAKIGVNGITVVEAKGTGLQKGYKETYRGVTREISLHDRIKIEIVVCEVPVQQVIDLARKNFNTGEPGDGKIFIYELANVIKIRTAEEGRAALKNEQ
nr:P-II family nitrogen regulator [Peribacillus loiseleuriae]